MPFPFREAQPKKKKEEEKPEYLSDKYPIEGEGDFPNELKGKIIIYVDKDKKTKWILHPDYINPDKKENQELIEKARKLLEESEYWPLH